MSRPVDLDSIDGLERAWAQLERRRAVRALDPELRAAIIRRCAYLPADVAAPVLVALDEAHPAAVLEAHFAALASPEALEAVRRRREERSA